MLNMLMIIAGELTEANQATESGRTGISAVLDNFNTIIETIQNLCLVIGIVIVILLVFASFFSVRKRSTKYTKAQITELKKSGKYIPGVFVELNESKEVLRYFLNGEKWTGRVIRKYNFIYKNFYGDILRQANNDENIRLNLSRRETLGEIENAVGSALDYHERFSKGQVKLKESYKESEHLFRIVYHPYLDALQELQSFVQASNRNYIVLTGSAGNGKTNLLCSIAELAINLKQPVLFLNSRDIDGTVIEYIQDSLRVQEQLKKHPKVYFRTLNTLLAIRGKHFFIIIDAINENDHEDFGAAINKFVNAMAEYPRIKILVSCRSEYYTERFSEPLSKTITQNHLVYDLKSSAYPETAIKRLFGRYAEHYNFSGHISEAVKYVLSQHLLLLRIFFEVNQNSAKDIMSICKHEVFFAYIQHVRDSVSPKIEKILDCIADTMLANMAFDYIDLGCLSSFSEDELLKACDETVLINKKLISHASTIARTEKEVVTFVFDEMRDYYIARRIMQTHTKEQAFDCDSIISFIQALRKAKVSCEEGVIHYTYAFFRTAPEIGEEDRKKYCNQILDFYRIEDGHETQYWHRHHREDFMNYGLKVIFTLGLPLTNFETEFTQDCLRKAPEEDGGKIFDTLLLGTMLDMENDLDKYLDILFGLRDKEAIISAFQTMHAHTFDESVDLPLDLIKHHKEVLVKEPRHAEQIQQVAELYMLMFRLNDKERQRQMESYFSKLPNHKAVKEKMLERLIAATSEGE